MTYRSAKSFFRIFGWAGTAALALAVFVASAPTTADAYAVNYINISYPGGCQILPGDSLQTCDIDPGGTLGPFVGTMDWQAGFPSPLPAMGMGSETSYGYLPGTVPLGCTSSTAYPGATLGNSGVPTGFGGDQICEVAFNSAFAGVGQGQYMFYASPSATPGQRYYMHLSSHNPYPPVITPFYIRIRPAAVCNINSFTADNTTVGYNSSTNLRFTLSGNFAWNISTISGSGLANPSSGTSSSGVSSSGNLTNTTTYRLTCGPDSQDVTVVVPSAPVCSPANTSGSPGSGINLSASGGDGNYSWSTPSSSTFCGNSASCVVTYSSAGSYSATVTSAGRSSTCNVSVSSLCGNGVVNLGEQCDGSNLNGQTCASQGFVTGTLSCNANCTFNTSACSSSGTQSISASKLSCTGSNATYTIHAVSTANNFYIKLIDSLGSTNIMTSMNEPVTSAGGRDYTTGPWVTNNMRFQLINAGTGAVMAETNVGNTGCSSPSPTCTITASPNSGTGSVSGSLSWSSSNATSCTASGGWSGSKPTSGSQSYGTVNSTTTYNLSCTNGTTSGSCSATVTVGAAQRYSCSGSSCVPNASGPYTTSNCNNSCSVQRYSCSGSSCVPNASGPYTTSNCNNSCFAGFPVSCSPSTQTVSIGQPATLIAANGNGTYAWSAPGGNPSAGFSSLFQPTYFSQGTYSVMVSSNGTNAFCSVTVSPPASQSDLTITDFHLTDAAGNTKSAFTPTDNIYPSVTIQNNSASPATPSTGYFYISIYSNSPGVVGTGAGSDVSVWAKEAGSIPAFGSKTYSVTSNSANWTNDGSNRINWTKGVGSYTARAFVDSFNYVTEINESNNQATFNYSVASAPTTATISLSPGNMIFYGLKGLVSNQIVRPTAKTLTISNTGAGTLNWSGTTNQPWCHISVASGSIAPGGSSPVSVTMDDPSNGGIFNCTITISAPNTTNSPQSIVAVYNVTTCGGASPQNDTIPYGTNTRDVTLSNVTNASNVNFPTWSDINGQDDIQWYPGAQTQFAITSACGSASKNYVASAISYGGDTFCASGTPTPVSPAFPNQGESVGWTCQGSAGAWDSTPCSASRQSASCTTLTFRPATSGLSLSNTGPSGTTLNVLPGQTYYAYADYGQVIGYISGPAGCSWENWNGTAARFRCTAPGTPGSYANTTGIFSGGGYCMSGPTTLGRVVVPSTDWKAAINLNNHRPGNPDYGQFYTHAYAYNVGGGSVYCDAANFTRAQQANVTADIKANGSDGPITVSYNQPANITWSSSNATGCSISPGSWTGTTGNQNTPSLVSSVTYTLNCVNGAQTATDSVTINIPPMPSNPVGLCPAPGTTVTASWTPAPGYTHYYFRAYDQANGWNNCTGTDICNEDVVGTSYTFPGIPGHTYSWWVHTRDAATGAYSNAVGAIVSCASAVCPAGSVNLSSPSVLVGQTVTASAPGGWSGGAYNSSNSGIASVSASTIRGMSVGAANITGYGWTAPNGAANCSLAGTNLNVSQPASPTISLNPTSFTFNGVSGQANPGTQSLRISNTGSATLNWTSGGVPGKPGTWCWVSPSSGSVPAGGQQNVSVTVSNPTNIGTFSDCGIRISDPSATNNPQDVSVTYVVIAPPASCPAGQVSLASASIIKGTTTTASAPAGWSAGSFVSSNTAVASVSGSTVTGVNAGTANITGSGWTASNGATNCALAARGVTVTNIPPPGGTGASGGSFCRQVVINWIDNSIGEQGFKVYRNTNNDPASASLITPAPNFIPSTSSNATGGSYSYTDTPPQSNVIYYYWVTAYTGAVESSRASGATGGINNTSCDASLTSSGKDIISVNQVANNTSDCSTTSQFPANVQFKAGDVIGYGFKLCNYPTGQPLQGVNAATSIVINDTMTNLERYDKAYPLTDPRAWNASVTSGISINKIEVVSANEPNRIQLKITLNGSVAGNSTEKLFLYAKTAMPTDYSGSSSRFQNSMQLTYVADQSAGTPGTTVTKSTPLLLFVKPQAPTKTETSP